MHVANMYCYLTVIVVINCYHMNTIASDHTLFFV